jgi:F0F1-type ATP synthase assembly protein I
MIAGWLPSGKSRGEEHLRRERLRRQEQQAKNLLRYATAGLEFFLIFLVGVLGGWSVDHWVMPGFGLLSLPSFTIFGAMVGFSVGLYRLVRKGWLILKTARKEKERRWRAKQSGGTDAGQE